MEENEVIKFNAHILLFTTGFLYLVHSQGATQSILKLNKQAMTYLPLDSWAHIRQYLKPKSET